MIAAGDTTKPAVAASLLPPFPLESSSTVDSKARWEAPVVVFTTCRRSVCLVPGAPPFHCQSISVTTRTFFAGDHKRVDGAPVWHITVEAKREKVCRGTQGWWSRPPVSRCRSLVDQDECQPPL